MLLDTSGLFEFFDSAAPQHADAATHFATSPQLLTHNYVLAEFVALAKARGLDRYMLLEFAAEVHDNPSFEVVHVTEGLHRAALDLLRQRLDKAWSLCDAVSFLLMGEYGITDALTTDHHFEQAGFVRLLRP